IAASSGVTQQLEQRTADPHFSRVEIVHLDVARIEQGDALLGVEHADAMRQALERSRVQRKRLRLLRRIGAGLPSVTGSAHPWPRPVLPPVVLRGEYVMRLESPVNWRGLNCVTGARRGQPGDSRSCGRLTSISTNAIGCGEPFITSCSIP